MHLSLNANTSQISVRSVLSVVNNAFHTATPTKLFGNTCVTLTFT